MQELEFSRHQRCASAQATATIEVRISCTLSFRSTGSRAIQPDLLDRAAQHFRPCIAVCGSERRNVDLPKLIVIIEERPNIRAALREV
ncbi:MAG: hypothetical protein AUI12_16455 [Acidobacteria bacterium 13_2_20CM_2_57_6]|nr:MAG: hypothetical protein AUH16_11695 [Acidobacteria bacterium 13_2_20CM_57_7]OLB83393.1 MAG: hypothetical protein AUI12_16455 [Acidobacteria bacterium 13_2_20CM_2_57_6]PYT38328.1 MAG: hypothetical protein DMG45_24295 [Acidobacteriota bacterium]PYT46583.1 MAG: hypothetical protein DMG47_04055 [Acidobacteriota bacterium]PYT60893.1 MAG: hypothetical protein DMG46_06275 [Acidobacteriota bacterium]